MTKDELKQRIIPRLVIKYRQELTLPDVVSAFQNSTQLQRNALVRALADGRNEIAGRVLAHMVNTVVTTQATTEADSMLADDVMTLAEIERAFNR